MESQQQESITVANAHVITIASTPLGKTYPKTKLVMALAVLLGGLAGVGAAYVRHLLDRSVRNSRQIREELGLAYIGSLPRLHYPRWNPGSQVWKRALDASQSQFTAALQSVKLSLDVERRTRGVRSIGILSLHPGEGATTCCTGLAALLVQSGAKALLLDADFQRRTLSRRAAANSKEGLLDLLQSGNDSVIVIDPNTNASVLPLSGRETLANSVNVLSSQPMRSILARFSTTYDLVLVDLPALDQGGEARAIGPFLDGCILVVEWGQTTVDDLRDAIAILQMGQVTVMGAVINQTEPGVPPLLGPTLAHLGSIDWVKQFHPFVASPLSDVIRKSHDTWKTANPRSPGSSPKQTD
jgi:succinoglycan biosynthesis transport protein ExoP